jgi:hypothetical protein
MHFNGDLNYLLCQVSRFSTLLNLSVDLWVLILVLHLFIV